MLTSNGYQLDESPRRLGTLVSTPDGERTDRDALWRRLRRQGYLYLPGQLPTGDVWDFRRYFFATLAPSGLVRPGTDPLDGIAAHTPPDRAALRDLLFNRIVPSAQYQGMCSHPAIRNWFIWFLGGDVHLHKRKILRHTRPGEKGIGVATQAHYDLVYLREGTDRVLSAWVPLGDCPENLGPLTYLEGTHRVILAEEAAGTLKRPARSITADLPKIANEYDSRWLRTDFRAGDVVIHSAHIIHAAFDNVSADGVMRLSTDIRYQRLDQPIDWRWQEHWRDDDGL